MPEETHEDVEQAALIDRPHECLFDVFESFCFSKKLVIQIDKSLAGRTLIERAGGACKFVQESCRYFRCRAADEIAEPFFSQRPIQADFADTRQKTTDSRGRGRTGGPLSYSATATAAVNSVVGGTAPRPVSVGADLYVMVEQGSWRDRIDPDVICILRRFALQRLPFTAGRHRVTLRSTHARTSLFDF